MSEPKGSKKSNGMLGSRAIEQKRSAFLGLATRLQVLDPSPKKESSSLHTLKERIRTRKLELSKISLAGAERRTLDKCQRKLDGMENKAKRLERANANTSTREALAYLGRGIHPSGIFRAAGLLSLCSFLVMVVIDMQVLGSITLGLMDLALMVLLPTMVIPLIVLLYMSSYPEHMVKKLRMRTLGQTPNAIHYMALSMNVEPSLERAIAFAAANSPHPLGTELDGLLWKVQMREHTTLEEGISQFAMDWGERSEDFKTALFAIRGAALEGTHSGREAALDKATQSVLSGTKRRIESFAASLTSSTTVLFALGIILPLVVGSMLPMGSLGDLSDPTSLGSTADVFDPDAWHQSAILTAVLMDCIFPVAAFGYSLTILARRPGTSEPPEVGSGTGNKMKMVLALLLTLGFGLPSLYCLWLLLAQPDSTMLAIFSLTLAGLGLCIYPALLSWRPKKARDKVLKMEKEFPDALFQLGSRIAEGDTIEAGMAKVVETMKGSGVAGLFQEILARLHMTRSPLEEVLFAKNGVLESYPSASIRTTMRAVVALEGRDNVTAGKALMGISRYLRDLTDLEQDIKANLSPVVATMRTTTIMFAPLVMGITSAIYVTLSGAFSKLSATSLIPQGLFTIILGAYLLLNVLIISNFSAGIQHGGDRIERGVMIATGMPVAVAVFAVSTLLGQGIM